MVVRLSKALNVRVRLRQHVRLRDDVFGGIVYVGHRDDFFAATHEVFACLKKLGIVWAPVHPDLELTYTALARLGICQTEQPSTNEEAYSGASFLGPFPELPTVSDPLVLNCFATAHCPLKCIYCHADDLMQQFRTSEADADLENVAATARLVPAITAVITGGDPLTRPRRAAWLIEQLSNQKALVLDTSGVGPIEELLPTLKANAVHVRVSLDSVSPDNDRIRPINRQYVTGLVASSRLGAERTIEHCLARGIPVTVQTVLSNRNENTRVLRDLRDWLVARGVRNWVLHVAVRGGAARRIEREAAKRRRGRGILPSRHIYSKLSRLVFETRDKDLPIDIRCTDTDTTPNSVLLVGSQGDLFTEGYAHDGKVRLFAAGESRPDLIRASWFHLDRFGHARRYLNWHPWLSEGKSLEQLCYQVSIPSAATTSGGELIESELKYQVLDVPTLDGLLLQMGWVSSRAVLQRDEYFDTKERALAGLDFVVRLRKERESIRVGFKGPRFYSTDGVYSRIELEVDAAEESSLRAEFHRRGLGPSWIFEKRRVAYAKQNESVQVALDEVPEVGHFLELEGRPSQLRELVSALRPALGRQETRNYKELFVAFKEEQGAGAGDILGAEFGAGS
jgi:predicted adenylyl cyclase CyaB